MKGELSNRIVLRNGVRFEGNTYYHPCLDELVGKKVNVSRSGEKLVIGVVYQGRYRLVAIWLA